MKNYIFLATLFFLSFTSFTQHNWGVRLELGGSQIYNQNLAGIDNYSQNFGPSGLVGISYNYDLTENSTLGADLLFSQIEGRTIFLSYPIYILDGVVIEGESPETIKTQRHISYLSLPIYYGHQWKGFVFRVGLQGSWVLASSYNSTFIGKSIEGEEFILQTSYKDLPIDSYDFGAIFGLGYELNPKWTLSASYYQGFNDIYNVSSPNGGVRNKQITIGARYAIFSK